MFLEPRRLAAGSKKGGGVPPKSDSYGINPITGLPQGESQADFKANDTPQRRRMLARRNPEDLPPAGSARMTQPPGGKTNIIF